MTRDKFLIFIFFVILLLPTLDSIFYFSPVKNLFEKRLPVEAPNWPKNFEEIKKLPQNFENFFNDNYGFRKTLILANSRLMDKVFDESPDSRALIGKDEWLYFDNHNSLLDAQGKAEISDELVELGVESFAKNWHEMRAKKIDYLLVIAADKSTIYPEFLPDYIKPKGPHRIDKFLAALIKKYPDFPVLDLRPILLEAKKKEILYHQTDTHWNKRGAHYAYVAIMNRLKISPYLRQSFENKEDEQIRGDISDIMSSNAKNINYDLTPKFFITSQQYLANDEVMKKFHRPILFKNINQNLPNIFVYKDSFFSELSAMVAQHFSTALFVNEFPCDLKWQILENHAPNVVIQEFWEGRIELILKTCQQ